MSWSRTDRGAVRPSNQDSFVDRPELGFWAVADGAGGHAEGEVASGLLCQGLEAIPVGCSGDELIAEVRARIAQTHTALRLRALARVEAGHRPDAIVSTVVVLMIAADHFACLWAGDSRAYRLRHGTLKCLTHDHSVVQELIDAGAVTFQEAKRNVLANVITRAVGAEDADPELEKRSGRILRGDRFLLCSDGLTKELDEAEIASLVAQADPACALVDAALDAHASDNVTAVIVAVP